MRFALAITGRVLRLSVARNFNAMLNKTLLFSVLTWEALISK